ncbi:MAG: oxygen-independent coproporphyrinogen III oxidase [candidate division Zixibacteria bacterium]|nr:oxygen-independent coproporphyrinogen III oxidase [candidate division Zixibacteria bacterium]
MNNETTATTVPVELLRKYDRPGPRYTSYPTAPVWTDEVGTEAYVDALGRASQHPDAPLALYCHIPFCRKRCYYCGCNTYITNNPARVDYYITNLCREIERTAGLLKPRRKVNQLHFGGGTPTYVDITGMAAIFDCLEEHFDFVEGGERSIELDPRVTTREQLDFLIRRGFNRVSIGVQDFDPDVQEASGRVQPEKTVTDMLDYCHRLNLKGINFDLIYGLPRQTVAGFMATLDKTIALRPDRLAVYSFAYLPTVKSHQSRIRPEELPSTEVKYQLFAAAVEKFTAAGYRQIGMDHFALPTDELSLAQADGRLHRNFMGYTVQSAPEMIGFGMSSIGYVDNSFFQNHSKLDSYKQSVSGDGLAVFRGMRLSDDDLIRQYVITSLMCNFRLKFSELKTRFDIVYHDYFGDDLAGLAGFVDDGFLVESETGLTITPLGRTFVRNIAMTYDAYLKSDSKKATFSRTI